MPGITQMTGFGIKDGTGEVTKRVSGEICPKKHTSNIISNPGEYCGVKASGVMETHFHTRYP